MDRLLYYPGFGWITRNTRVLLGNHCSGRGGAGTWAHMELTMSRGKAWAHMELTKLRRSTSRRRRGRSILRNLNMVPLFVVKWRSRGMAGRRKNRTNLWGNCWLNNITGPIFRTNLWDSCWLDDSTGPIFPQMKRNIGKATDLGTDCSPLLHEGQLWGPQITILKFNLSVLLFYCKNVHSIFYSQ